MTPDLVVPAAVLADADLRPAAKLILARLLELVRGGGLVFASRSALARDLGMSARAVESALRALERGGRIVREVSHGGRNRPRGYRVLAAVPRLAALRALPAGDEGSMPARKPIQLCLFDASVLSKEGRPSAGFART